MSVFILDKTKFISNQIAQVSISLIFRMENLVMVE